MAKRARHTHKYIFQQLSKFNSGWRCALDYCDHFLPRNVEDTISGRMCVCWSCDEDFKLDEDAIKDAREVNFGMPRCIECRMTPEDKENREKLREKLDAMGVFDHPKDPLEIALKAAREKREEAIRSGSLIPLPLSPLSVIEPKVHTDGCASRAGSACDCEVK